MKRFTEILSGSAAVLFQMALTGWMFALSKINFDFAVMELNYLLLSAIVLAAYFINMAVMRRGVPVPVFAIIELIIVGAGAFAFVKCVRLEPFALRTVIINCVIYCLGFFAAAYLAWTPTSSNSILIRFDCLAVMSLVMIVLDELLTMPGAKSALMMCWICLALTLLAAISLKSGALIGRGRAVEGNAALGRIMLIVAFGLLGVIALAVIGFATVGFKSFSEFLLTILTAVVKWVKAALLYLYRLFERFMLWLAQFAKDVPVESGETEAVPPMELPAGEELAAQLPGWIYYVLIAIVAAILVFVVFKLRKHRAVRVVSHRYAAVKVQRESGLGKALRELLERLRILLRYRWNCLRLRRSAAGLLAWCERKSPEEFSRRTDESGPRFLRRLSAIFGEQCLENLALLVERSFYSPHPVTVPPALYKSVRKLKFKVEKDKT